MSVNEANPSELELSKQRIAELEAENVNLRRKLSVSDAEIAELKRSNNEFLRANKEYNERRDAENAKLKARIEELESENIEVRDRLTKVEQKQSQNDNTPNNILSNFNSGAVHHEKPLEEKEMDNFLLEAHKKIVSSEIKQRNKEKKLHTESMTSSGQEVAKQSGQNSHKKKGTEKIVQVITDGMMAEPSIQDNVTEVSATARRPNCSSSLLDLAKLFDKATDAEYRTKKANEEEILCWVNFGKEFMVHFSELVENSNGKIGEKKAKGIIYDEMLEHLANIREKRSKEMGIQLPKISRSSLTRRTQRSMKLVRIFEKIEVIEAQKEQDNSAKQDDFPTPEISADEEEYIKMLTGGIDDETLYGGTPYENSARVEKEEVNKVKESPRVQSDDENVPTGSDEEVDHDSVPHPVEETNDDSDCNHDNDSEEEMPDDSDDDGYDRYGGYDEWGNRDRGYYSPSTGIRVRKTSSPMWSPVISPYL